MTYSKDNIKTMVKFNRTARKGMRCLPSTYPKYCGKPPSRAHAHVKRDTEETNAIFPAMHMIMIPAIMAVVPGSERPVDSYTMPTIGL